MSRLNMQETRAEYEVWKRDYFGGMDRKMDEAAWEAWKYLTSKLEDAGRVYVNKNAECLALRKQLDATTEKDDRCKHGNDYHHCRRCDNEFDEEMS